MANIVNSGVGLGARVGKEGGKIVGYRHSNTIWRQGEGGEVESIAVGDPIPIRHYDEDGPVTIYWNQLNNEQKQILNPERYKNEQNRKF
ncbi:MAG: hypothetical protein MRJ93_05260 [Nitrososphaeraceae archaeon]|nr:hypothetical protein [Nitrososphaeraceae archaeon]